MLQDTAVSKKLFLICGKDIVERGSCTLWILGHKGLLLPNDGCGRQLKVWLEIDQILREEMCQNGPFSTLPDRGGYVVGTVSKAESASNYIAFRSDGDDLGELRSG